MDSSLFHFHRHQLPEAPPPPKDPPPPENPPPKPPPPKLVPGPTTPPMRRMKSLRLPPRILLAIRINASRKKRVNKPGATLLESAVAIDWGLSSAPPSPPSTFRIDLAPAMTPALKSPRLKLGRMSLSII